MSKYDPLRRHLEARLGFETPMRFSDIEEVLGFGLPDSARKFPAWWSNNTGTHVGVKAWRDAGFRTSRVDIPGERVTFVRDPGFPRDALGLPAPAYQASGVSEGDTAFAHRPPVADALTIPFGSLSLSALRMIDDWAEEAGVDRSTATAAILEASAAGRRRRLLESLAVAVMPTGHDSTALIREDRDAR